MASKMSGDIEREMMEVNIWWLLGLFFIAAMALAATWYFDRLGGVIFSLGFTVGVGLSIVGVYLSEAS